MATQTIERPKQRTTDPEALFPGRYLSVTSFKRDGTGVATPVWFVFDGRRLFAFTDLHSAKVRRIRRNAHVMVASCRPDGKLRGERVSFFYRVGRRIRGKQSVADGAALAITVE